MANAERQLAGEIIVQRGCLDANCFCNFTHTDGIIPFGRKQFQKFWTSRRKCCGCFIIYASDRRLGHKILCNSCTRSPITIGLDKKPFIPLSSALRRSSSKALAVMARMGSVARAGSSSARICRVAV